MITRTAEEPLPFQVLAKDCPSRAVLEHLTGRWAPLVLRTLTVDPQRFSEIRREIGGINEKALAQALRRLERDGFVARHASDGYPSRVEYSLTSLGNQTVEYMRLLIAHLESAMPDVLAAQAAYDERQTS